MNKGREAETQAGSTATHTARFSAAIAAVERIDTQAARDATAFLKQLRDTQPRTATTWVPWQLAPDSDPEQRFILVNKDDDGEEHPDGIKYNTAEEATAAAQTHTPTTRLEARGHSEIHHPGNPCRPRCTGHPKHKRLLFVDALRVFEDAANRLSEVWDNDADNSLYPFAESFDDLTHKITEYRESVEKDAPTRCTVCTANLTAPGKVIGCHGCDAELCSNKCLQAHINIFPSHTPEEADFLAIADAINAKHPELNAAVQGGGAAPACISVNVNGYSIWWGTANTTWGAQVINEDGDDAGIDGPASQLYCDSTDTETIAATIIEHTTAWAEEHPAPKGDGCACGAPGCNDSPRLGRKTKAQELREQVVTLNALLLEAHDTHIYSPDDTHPADCEYCKATSAADAVLQTTQRVTRETPDPEHMNANRSGFASAAVEHFQEQTGTDDEDAVADLLADLMHFCDRDGYDFDAELARARMHYTEETSPEDDAERARR